MPRECLFPAGKSRKDRERSSESHYDYEVYQAFMAGYVKRINDSTLRVPIGGVRIGSAKYSRLAQINLRTHIITFSRYAIENVPERGRRYLVLHELAHVKEPSHNKDFWQIVAAHEPRYKEIGKELELAFHQNVREELRQSKKGLIRQARLFPASFQDDWDAFRDSLETVPEEEFEGIIEGGFELFDAEEQSPSAQSVNTDPGLLYPFDGGILLPAENFDCHDGELGSWDRYEAGIVRGGSEPVEIWDDDYADHS
ncbi:MAG: M48 family metallopeptidase [Candidatus Obscuribacterales bacterium]|nr:M48 family metallopeptidase [Candidatus Obscuribacterales bacterium]